MRTLNVTVDFVRFMDGTTHKAGKGDCLRIEKQSDGLKIWFREKTVKYQYHVVHSYGRNKK